MHKAMEGTVILPGIKARRFVYRGNQIWSGDARKVVFVRRRQSSEIGRRFELSQSRIQQQRRGLARTQVKTKFAQLAKEWKQEASLLSSPSEMAMIPAYQQIIGMGQKVVPLLLTELKREPDFWFWALRAITGEDPVRHEDFGDVEKMTEAWLDWGLERGYL